MRSWGTNMVLGVVRRHSPPTFADNLDPGGVGSSIMHEQTCLGVLNTLCSPAFVNKMRSFREESGDVRSVEGEVCGAVLVDE